MNRIKQNNGINENTFNTLFESDKFKLRTDFKSNKEFLLYIIENFTRLNDRDAEEFIQKFPQFKRVDDLFYVMNDGLVYSFNRMDQITDFYSKQELLSKERYGHCCDKSMEFVNSIMEVCDILIGYIHYTEKRIVHAVVEYNTFYGPIIIDYTKNLVMKKSDYFDLTEFKLINKVSNKDLKKDLPVLAKTGFVPVKVYLLYRKEIMKDFNKNKKVLGLK